MNENLAQSNINREYKDRLFNFIFGSEEHKDWTLSLYNAINGSDYNDPSVIEFNTLKDAMYISMRNDTSFIVSDIMSVYEHQSSFNPNMPVRLLQYVGNLYAGYIEKHKYNKYGTTLIPLPVPKLVVFYNGGRDVDDETVLKLSDSFPEESRDKSDIEVRVRMINVNYDRNRELMEKCQPLKEYSWFISDIKDKRGSGLELTTAVDRAIKAMPDDFAIKEYLLIHRQEVQGMLDTEYNEAEVMEGFRQEGRREGIREGISSHIVELVCKKLRKGKDVAVIADELEESESTIEKIYAVASKYAPDYDEADVYREYSKT